MERRRRVRQKAHTTRNKDALLPFDLSSSSHRDANLRTDGEDRTEDHRRNTVHAPRPSALLLPYAVGKATFLL